MTNKQDVWQGTLALMILKTLETMGPQHGYGIARRIEQTSGHSLLINYGTLYPALLKLDQEGYIKSGLGSLRQQPARQVLPADADGTKAARTRRPRLGAHHRDPRAFPHPGRGL